MNASAIIVAGGTGKRMGAGIPKQLLELGGKTILERTLDPFLRCEEVGRIVIAAAEPVIEEIRGVVRSMDARKDIAVVPGGRERQDSVWNALIALGDGSDAVAVHDAVRPFITPELIADCLRAAEQDGAVTVARPVKETVKVVEGGVVAETLDRSKLWIIQTPQAFRTELLVRAHEAARKDGFAATDDCMLVERIGHPVRIIEGDDMNIKITTPADLRIAGAVLALFGNGERG